MSVRSDRKSMKNTLLIIPLTIIFLVSSCAPATQSTPVPIVDNATATPSPTPTADATRTALPSATLTASITPLPTIPTFTPTFDVSTIVTVTPAPKAECPKENPELTLDLHLQETRACFQSVAGTNKNPSDCINRNIQNDILDYLNQGGTINHLISQIQADGQKENVSFAYKDLTNDSIRDFVFRDTNSPYDGYHIYSCNNRIYKTASILDGDPYANQASIYTIQDLNANDIPEVVIKIAEVLIVYEWDGNSFTELLGIRDFGESTYEIQDIDKNGTYEIILFRGRPPFWNRLAEFPWRHYTSIYSWNRSSYIISSKRFTSPEYRFQAIQDADQYVLSGEYDQALTLYQDTIINNKLDWWSIDRKNYEAGLLLGNSKLPVMLNKDFTEYPRLAAYAYYRIMLIHLVQGHASDASTAYNTLQQKFGNDQYGHPYVEMATAFWKAYQSTHKMYDGCAAAIQYAAEHPEILIPLGSDYHGWQSHQYKPEDVCPFR